MERQLELRVLLKRWEAEFLRERRRKPSQADIEEAPEETRKLYKEYKALKQQRKTAESSGKTLECAGNSSESSGKTSESSGKTSECSGKALECAGKLLESSGKTLENSSKSLESSGKSSESSGKTTENSSKSSESSGNSSENSGKTSESSRITWECSGKTTESSGKTSENSSKTSESSGKSSENSGKTLESSGITSESSGKTSETSGKSWERAGNSSESSGKSSEIFGKTAEISGKTLESSGKTSESSGKTMESSGKTTESSRKTLESSGKSSECSGKAAESSGKTSESSRKTSESSGKTTESSGKTTESSRKTSESSGKAAESSGKTSEISGKSSESSGTTGSREMPNPEQPEDSGFWGSHLNRAAKIPEKSRSRSPRPGISAEFYGMKLKAKLGATGKEPPLTPRRTPKPPRSQKTPEPGAEPPPPSSRNEEKRENPEIPEGIPELILPLRLPPGKNRDFPPAPEKFRLLKRKVAETLSSLDPAWIERCREWPEKREFAATGGEKIPEKREFAATGGEKIPEKWEFAAAGGEKIPEKWEFAAEGGEKIPEKWEFAAAGGEKITEKREFAAAGEEKIPPKSRNSGRKRARGGAEAPAKRLRGSDPGISAMGRIQEEEEDEGGISGAAEEIPEKGGKAKGARGARSSAPNSGNFVRLNLKRKIYSRCSLRGKFLRKQVWKRKWRKKFGAASERCFRCGGEGHWAAGCPGLGWTPQNVPEEERPEPEQIPTPEAAAPSGGGGFVPEAPGDESDTENCPEFPRPPPPVEPLYPLNADGTIPDPPEEVLEALRILGHESFRPGQAEAIMRVLCGISTLVVLPTGTGKSLCYQLPAFLHHRNSGSICLVISPLVSLMDDQVSGLPSALRAVCVHSNLSQSRREAALEDVRSGRAQILLLSPESLTTAGAFSRFFRNFPPVAFACLDEVHCISQWSHNFRPAYLRVCKVLRELGGVRCFLGLTATATAATLRETAALLRVPEGRGLGVRAPAIPPNLRLSVSVEPDRDRALLRLLRRWRRAPLLLFCSRRRECERLAQLIQDEGTGDGRAAAAYHAGLAPRERGRVQRELAAGAAGVVCATAALGLGLHRGGARGVLHYNAPPSLEAYAQQIGRAGRDGAEATCHLFLDVGDLLELRRHVHENSVDFPALQTLLRRVFAPCKCREKQRENSEEIPQSPERRRICRGHERSVPVQELVQALDLREEGVQTLLCLLELHPGRLLELFPATRSRCRILAARSRLSSAASSCPPLAFLLAREASGIPGISGISGNSGISRALEFDAVALSDAMGWEFRTLRRSLGRLAGNGIRVEFQELSFHFRSYGDLEPRELKSVREFLNSHLRERENFELRRLRRCFRTFQSVASLPPAAAESRLRELLLEYFQSEPDEEQEEEEEEEEEGVTAEQEEEARAEIRKLLCAYPDEEFTGRAVARIFHGIGSPRFPASVFGRDRRFWRRLLPLEFRSLSRLASQEILALK